MKEISRWLRAFSDPSNSIDIMFYDNNPVIVVDTNGKHANGKVTYFFQDWKISTIEEKPGKSGS